MTRDELRRLVAGGESETLEFKRSTGQLTRAGETLCGMLNGEGGAVLLGVTDAGEIVGQEVADSTIRAVAAMLSDLEPLGPARFERLPVSDGREVIALHAEPTPGLGPWTYRGRPWQRVGSTTSPMRQADYLRCFLDRGQGVTMWETLPAVDCTIDDLDQQEILKTVRLGIAASRLPEDVGQSIPDILDRFQLRRDGQITNAAVVLFGRPSMHYPQCGIRLARFDGTTKDEFIDNRQERGNAFALLDEATTFFRRHLSIAGRFREDRIERQDIPEYPVFALREAVVNALIHRSYVTVGGAVNIAIYDDRLEIWSDGLLPFGQRPEELKLPHTSRPRNPIIASVFYRRGLIEAWGRGTQRIVEQCVRAGLPEPDFGQQAGSTWVRFLPRPEGPRPAALRLDLTHLQRAILGLIEREGPLALRELAGRLEDAPPHRALRAEMYRLRDQGLVEAVGRGRGATWRLRGTENRDE